MSRVFRAVVAVVVLVGSTAGQRPSAPSISELLDAYDRREFQTAVHAGASLPSLTAWKVAYPIEAQAWIERGNDRGRRRLAAAGFLLEVVDERFERDWRAWDTLSSVVEWACQEVRRGGVSSEGKHAWFRASVAFGQRTRDWAWLAGEGTTLSSVNHLAHARSEFGSDKRLDLALTIARADRFRADTDLMSRPARLLRGTGTPGITTSASRTLDPAQARRDSMASIALFGPLLKEPDVAGDAEVRISHLYLMMRDYPNALDHARAAVRVGRDPSTRYLGEVLAGRALEGLNRSVEARTAYAEGLRIMPKGQSAALLLAVSSPSTAPSGETWTLVEQSFAAAEREEDPYRLYYYGDYVHWPALVGRLRAALP